MTTTAEGGPLAEHLIATPERMESPEFVAAHKAQSEALMAKVDALSPALQRLVYEFNLPAVIFAMRMVGSNPKAVAAACVRMMSQGQDAVLRDTATVGAEVAAKLRRT